MIAVDETREVGDVAACAAKESPAKWQDSLLELLPGIERRLRLTFGGLASEAKEEAVQESVCGACRAFARLAAEGRTGVATAGSLARYAASQYRAGRRLGTPRNVNDVSSKLCQLRRGFTVGPLGPMPSREWQDALIEDRTVTPAELAISRIDFLAFIESLAPRSRRIAEVLATGESTSSAARLFGVSAARISQIRRDLHTSWLGFNGEPSPALRPEPV